MKNAFNAQSFSGSARGDYAEFFLRLSFRVRVSGREKNKNTTRFVLWVFTINSYSTQRLGCCVAETRKRRRMRPVCRILFLSRIPYASIALCVRSKSHYSLYSLYILRLREQIFRNAETRRDVELVARVE